MGIYILNLTNHQPLKRLVVKAEDSLQAVEIGLEILQVIYQKQIRPGCIHLWLASEEDSEYSFFLGFISKINRLEKEKHELNKIH